MLCTAASSCSPLSSFFGVNKIPHILDPHKPLTFGVDISTTRDPMYVNSLPAGYYFHILWQHVLKHKSGRKQNACLGLFVAVLGRIQKYFVWTSYPCYLNIYSAIKSCSLAVKDHFFPSKSLGSENIRSSFMACSECLIVSLWGCELRRVFQGSRPAKNRFDRGEIQCAPCT